MKKAPYSLATAEQLNGKELSYNNIQDANAALNIVREFTDKPFAVGLKHMNPCGAGVGETIAEAWTKAYEGDKTSIFGGIVAFNREVDLETAQMLKPIFLEIVMAPSFAPDALELLCTKKNLRVLKVEMGVEVKEQMSCVSVNGGLLVQNQDLSVCPLSLDQCVTETKPTEEQMRDLEFTWKMVKHVKSNAIAVGCGGMLLGVGAGQMNRVGSAEIALKHAVAFMPEQPSGKGDTQPQQSEDGLRRAGAAVRPQLVLASDAFFPFDDCVTLAAEYGVKAIVQPGGSIRDEDSIKKCNELGIAMLFTGERHFKH